MKFEISLTFNMLLFLIGVLGFLLVSGPIATLNFAIGWTLICLVTDGIYNLVVLVRSMGDE